MKPTDRIAGFTLMETLVALVVFSLASVAILDIFSRAARSQVRAGAIAEATSVAGRLIAEVEMADFFSEQQGITESGLAWRLVQVPIGPRLLRVTVDVEDRAGRRLRAETVRSVAQPIGDDDE